MEMRGHADASPGEAPVPLRGAAFGKGGLTAALIVVTGTALLLIAAIMGGAAADDSDGISVSEVPSGGTVLHDDAETGDYTFIFKFDLNGNPHSYTKETETHRSETGSYTLEGGYHTFTYEGHYFRGWDRNKNAAGDDTELKLHSSYTFKATGLSTTIQLYAIYDTVFDGEFHPAGGTITKGAAKYSVPVNDSVEFPTVVWADEIEQDSSAGGYRTVTHTFDGWWTAPQGTRGEQYNTSGTGYFVPIFQHLQIYAHWTTTKGDLVLYRVTLDPGEGTCSTTSAEGALTLPEPVWKRTSTTGSNCYTTTEHTFKGWYLNGASYAAGSKFVPSSDCTLTAGWSSTSTTYYQYWLKFDTGGGSSVSTLYWEYTGSSYAAPVPSTCPDKTGYVFKGWSKLDGGSVIIAAGHTGTMNLKPGTTTLHAVWEKKSIGLHGTPEGYAVVGSGWSYTPSTDASGCTFRVSGAPWISVSSGTVSGTPDAAGSCKVTVTASCDGYDDQSQTFTITVLSELVFLSQPSAGVIAYAA